MTDYYFEGRDAFYRVMDKCPYERGTEAYYEWYRGYDDANEAYSVDNFIPEWYG
jgi:hypothetical protein